MNNNDIVEPFFVNYAVRGCQCQAGRSNQSYVQGYPLEFQNNNYKGRGYYNGYPDMYNRKGNVNYVYSPVPPNAAYANPSSDYVYVFKGFTGGS